MTNKKLMGILTLVNSVKSNRWNDVIKIVSVMSSIKIKEKSYVDEYKKNHPEYYPLDLSKIDTWSTFDGDCISLVFNNVDDALVCKVNIYDGENLNGGRRDLRFTATLIMPDNFIQELKDKILYKLDCFAEDAYDDYLENKKNIWISRLKEGILNKTN